jgi:hypothetical protein
LLKRACRGCWCRMDGRGEEEEGKCDEVNHCWSVNVVEYVVSLAIAVEIVDQMQDVLEETGGIWVL